MTQRKNKHCGSCDKRTLHLREMPDKNMGCADLLLGILTAGLYFVIIILTRYILPIGRKWDCSECGS